MQTVSTAPASVPARTVNTASKDLLARILATENITVQHDPKAQTAAFDVKNRVLVLPAWTGMTNEVYDMLVGHEVGHALFTPFTAADEKVQGPWCGAAEEIAGTANASLAQAYMNIVEDARIEKLMKERFPGMRRDFFKAYEQFTASDFFGVKNRDLNTLPLIDRINLHYKMGTSCATGINFSPVEQSFLSRIDKCRTFDDVKSIVRDIWDYESNMKQDAEKQQQNGNGSTNGQGDDQGQSSAVPMSGDSSDEQGDGDDSGNSNSGSGEQSGENKRAGGDEGNEQGDKDAPKSKSKTAGECGGDMQHKTCTPPKSSTQEKFDQSIKQMTDPNKQREYTYQSLPSIKLENVIFTPADINKKIEDWRVDMSSKYNGAYVASHIDLLAQAETQYNKFVSQSAPVIALMAKQFDLRKAADAAKRTSVARTGVLDTVRMVNYKITDDIFRRNATIREGKNHGLVMFIDWSGSMSTTLMDTVKQLMQIALFCRRCNIPFEVYAFSTVVIKNNKDGKVDMYDGTHCWNREGDKVARFHNFTLFNFLSSKMRPNQFKQAMVNLFAITLVNNGEWTQYNAMPDCFGLSSTPLDESILAAMDIVPKFREDNRLQIVHTVFLTDGETSGSGLYNSGYYSRNFVTDPVTRKTYEISRRSTDTLLEIFRDRTKCNAIGFFLLGRGRPERYSHLFTPHAVDPKSNVMRVVSNLSQKDVDYRLKQYDSFKSDGFAIAHPTATGYTEQFIVRADVKIDDSDDMAKVSADSSMTQIKNAFIRNANKRMKTRVMLNRFIDLIAK